MNMMESMSCGSCEKGNVDSDKTVSSTLEQQKEITIIVESIENINDRKVKDVFVMVEFNGSILTQSNQTPIINSRADILLSVTITIEDLSPIFMNEILSNPVLFTIFDCTTTESISTAATIPSPTTENKKKISKTASPISLMQTNSVLGMCNLDIGPLVSGERRIMETLLVESDTKLTPQETVVWTKLPKLMVVATTGDEPLISKSISKHNNVLGITVESIYNVPDYIMEGSVFDACIQVPAIGDKNYRIKFPNGVATSVKGFCSRKKWVNLSHLDGPGAMSKYRILQDTSDLISDVYRRECLDNDIRASVKTIRWDMWRNCLMLKSDVNHFYKKLIKYQVWPIEILIPNKSKEQIQKDKSAKSDKKPKPAVSAPSSNGDHFTAFLNLAPLLYPGENKIRVAAPLMTYSQSDLVNKFGADFNSLQSQASIGTVKAKTASERSKASIRESEEFKDTGPGSPVIGANGFPTFIVVEVELLQPLCQKQNPKHLEEDLKDWLSIKGNMNKKTTNLDKAEADFSECIQKAVCTVTKEYETYSLANKEEAEKQIENDTNFYNYICNSKNFFRMRTTLENKIVDLICEKYGAMNNFSEKVPIVYTYLVNEMHKITNHYKAGQQDVSFPPLYISNLNLYAEEAFEEREYGLARDYLFWKLSRNTCNPNYWLDVAVFYIKIKAYDKAVEAVREALCLDFHHQMALLLYALLMGHTSNAAVAKMTFGVLLSNYPDYAEGWKVLRFFYICIGNTESAIIAQKYAKIIDSEKTEDIERKVKEIDFCMNVYDNDKYYPAGDEKYGMSSYVHGFSWAEPLSWTMTICPPDDIRMKTIVLLQKLGFYQYATMCLSDALLAIGKEDNLSEPHIYYTAVNHYLQRRYEDAIPLLQKYAKEYGKDCYIWSLLGHCYYKLENHAKAIACYEYVVQTYNRPEDIHLVYSRMGVYYLQAKKYECAKQILKTACKHSPTPRLWKGVGIACLMTQDFEESEIAFTEANYFDNRDPETWAYLAITNALLRRLDLFKQCYAEAKKRGLCNEKLIRKIKCFAKVNGLTDEEFNF